ncbi:MAG: TolC family protein, partial [Myxococcota bacterium]
VIEQTTYGPALTASWLLLDFGARSAALDEAREALVAADWGHHAALQQVILSVEQSYYDYVDARARLAAAESSVHEAETSLRAAEERLAAGVAAQLEVLQARTARSQARLLAQQLAGRIEGLRGALAVSLGLPASTVVEVESPPEQVPAEAMARDVGDLIAEAMRQRPELAAVRAVALGAATKVRSARAGALPSLSAVGQAGRTYYEPHPYARYGDNWSGGLVLRWPLFSGLSTHYDAAQAQSDAAAAAARVDSVAQQVALEVWQSYHDLKTAGRALESARDLVESAAQAERVAAGRYEQGVGDLLDLLTAQATLASARAQQIGTRSDWYVAVARLAHSIGALASTSPGSPIHDRP